MAILRGTSPSVEILHVIDVNFVILFAEASLTILFQKEAKWQKKLAFCREQKLAIDGKAYFFVEKVVRPYLRTLSPSIRLFLRDPGEERPSFLEKPYSI